MRPKPLQLVVVGSSLERESDAAVRTGAALAEAAGAAIRVVHTVELEPIVGRRDRERLVTRDFANYLDHQRSRLEAQLGRLGIDRSRLEALDVELRAPHRVLLEIAQEGGAGLLVVGPHRPRHGVGRLLGSTADRLIRKASCPVLVVRNEPPVPPRRVLAPVDLSPLSADSFRSGMRFLAAIGATEATTVEPLFVIGNRERRARPDIGPEELISEASAELDTFLASCAADGPCPATPRVIADGEPAEAILGHLEETPADLVMLGTHGVAGIERLLVGSTALAVVREAPGSVLLIPPVTSLGEAIGDEIDEQLRPRFETQ